MTDASVTREERWKQEAKFFDAEEYVEGPLPEATIRRYLELRHPWLSAEYPFCVLGDVRGKNILEIGSGDGTHAVLLALRGANVVGVDISGRAVEVATRRAALHCVSDRARFVCSTLESYAASECKTYDIILGFSILHHLLPVLDGFLADLKKLAHARTVFLFHEPVSLWKWLRAVRLALPLSAAGTPGERPLNSGDFAVIRGHFPNLEFRYFGGVQRIFDRFWMKMYETSSAPLRFAYNLAVWADYVLFHVMRMTGLASRVMIHSSRVK